MYVHKLVHRANARRAFYLSAMVLGGCGADLGRDGENGSRLPLNLSTLGIDSKTTYYENNPNHLFELAEFVEITDQPRVIRGSISGANDVDVYDLGPVFAGDRVVVTMTAADALDGAIGLFDDRGTALLVNDHRNVYLGEIEPFVDVVIRRESSACFVVVSSTPGFASTGDYALQASKEFPVATPAARPDIVLLVFDGGSNVRIGSRLSVNVPVFDAANVSLAYAGQTDFMIDEIVADVRSDFERLDVTILSTSEGDRVEPGYTRIYFGTYDEALLGVAEGVDEFNATRSQRAIVFTDTFAAFMRLSPTQEQMSQAIANVASHEIGHLLGMVHTEDPSGIMDVTASLSELLTDQSLARSPIYAAVFPLGDQDAVQYLLDTIGGDTRLLFAKAGRVAAGVRRAIGDTGHSPARTAFRLSTCCLLEH